MTVKIRYSEKAVKQLRRISKGDKRSVARIMEYIEAYAANPRGKFDLKILKGKYGDFKRLRIGDYRIMFEDDAEKMLVYEIRHRQEAYHD